MPSAAPAPHDAQPAGASFTLAMLLNLLQDAVILTDPILRITGWNHAAEALYGWSATEAVGQVSTELLQTDYLGADLSQLLQQLQTHAVWRGEVCHRHRDGHPITILATVIWMRDPHGEAIGALSLNRDISERTRMAAALRAREQQLTSVIESIDGRIWAVDRELRLLVGNTTFQRDVLAVTGQELRPGESIWALPLPPVYQEVWRASYVRALAGEAFSIEQETAGRTMVYRFMPIRTADENVSGVTVVGLDITAHRRTEIARQETERKLGALFELLPVGISILDAEHTIVHTNPALDHILQLNSSDRSQQVLQPRQYLRPDGTPMPTEELANLRVIREQQPVTNVETGIVTETGETIWTSVSAAPVDFPDWRLVVVTTDITARKRAEQELQRTTERLRILSDASHAFAEAGANYQALLERIVRICADRLHAACNIRLLSDDGQWLDIAAIGHYGLAEQQDMQASLIPWRIHLDDRAPAAVAARTGEAQFVPVIDREALPATIPPERRVLLQRFFPHSMMILPLRLHGRSIGSLMLARDAHETPSFNTDDLSLAQDLTDRAAQVIGNAQLLVRVQAELVERQHADAALEAERMLLARRVAERTADLSLANAELTRATRLKDEFLASMTLELPIPLISILGRAEALQESIYGPVTPEQIVAIQGIDESGRHLLSLINDILDLSKIEAGRLDLEAKPLQIDLLCSLCLRMVMQTAMSKQISLSSMYDHQVQTLVADERRLKQILVNLLSNAVKFTPEGGKVGLEMQGNEAAQTVTFTIWDSGIGIAADDLPKLFQPFIQLDSSLSRQYTGTGLGLALVARLAKAHGGSVAVESTPGEGSRFQVTLPWSPTIVSAKSAPETTVIPRTRPTISRAMVIEDSPTAAEQLARYLQAFGARVEVLPHGTGVITRAIALQPDVILLDILLSDDDGWHVLRQLKSEPRTQAIPVIIVSVVDQPEQARALGAAASLLKPIDRASLEQTLRRVLTRQEDAFIQLAFVATPATGRPKLLLAEDNEANIAIIADYLRAKGYDMVIARNGSEAVIRAQEERPDAILMDIQMPGMDGLEAIRRLRADAGLVQVPIIAVTALAMPGDRERCLEAGADDYLTKPIQLQRLVVMIETLRGLRG